MKRLLLWLLLICCVAYLTNGDLANFELIADALPGVGHLDEILAVVMAQWVGKRLYTSRSGQRA